MQAVALDPESEEALPESVAKPRKPHSSKTERKTAPRAPSLTPEEIDRLSEMTSVIDVRNQELGVKNETLGTAKKLANLAGDANPSSLNKWRGGNPSDPRLFHFRRYLLALGLDFQIVPKGGTVSRPALSAGGMGDRLTDYTKRLVAIMEKLPAETQKAILGTAMMYEKVWGGGDSLSPQAPSVEMGPHRGQANNDQGPQT